MVQPDSRFSLIEFSSEAVVYDRLSGDTHYLNPLAFARLLGRTQVEIAAMQGIPVDLELQEQLKALDEQFRGWGLAV